MIDLHLFGRVLWRFKFLVLGGFILAVLLATLAVAKVSLTDGKPVFAYREPQVWAAYETLLITQQGFPEGNAILAPTQTPTGSALAYADPGRFAYLADLYARLANSDAVQRRILPDGIEPPTVVTAAPVVSNIGNQGLLPMLIITGRSTMPQRAIGLTRAASAAFQSYLAERQAKAGIPDDQRVVISVLNLPKKAIVATPHKKTTPLMVFLAVLAAAVGLALILENLRPRSRTAKPASGQDAARQLRDLGEHRQAPPIAGVGNADTRG